MKIIPQVDPNESFTGCLINNPQHTRWRKKKKLRSSLKSVSWVLQINWNLVGRKIRIVECCCILSGEKINLELPKYWDTQVEKTKGQVENSKLGNIWFCNQQHQKLDTPVEERIGQEMFTATTWHDLWICLYFFSCWVHLEIPLNWITRTFQGKI